MDITITSIPLYFIISFFFIIVASLIIRANAFYSRPTFLNNQYLAINGLRGFLALGVFFHHSLISYFYHLDGTWQAPNSRFYTMIGQTSVAFFFAITAFLFWKKIISGNGSINWKNFYWSRVKRIYPMYLFSVVIIICFILSRANQNNGFLFSTVSETAHTLKEFFKYLYFGTPKLNLKDIGLINAGVFWTLSFEWKFYIALPFLSLLAYRKKLLMLVILAISLTSGKGLYFFFLAGMLSAEIKQFIERKHTPYKIYSSYWFDIAFVLLIIMLFSLFDTAYGILQACIVFFAFLCLLLGNGLGGLLHLKASQFLGEISYSIYLLHGIALTTFACFLPSNAYEEYYWFTTALIGTTVILVSSITHQLIEYRFYKPQTQSP